jgi:shikimate dehydrogenase
MYPGNGASPLSDLGIFKNCRAVVDLIYNPLRTGLLLEAEQRGITCVNGLAMLAAQAKKSAEIFLNSPVPDEKIDAATSKIYRLARNIILIGMPGCGKSVIAAALAGKMKRGLADTDGLVIKAAGKSIPEIFAQDGEEAFRELETAALRDVCKRSGLVIAAGGGILTRRENFNLIRQNGTVVFLDRNIGELPTSGRPLSELDGVAALAAVRLPLYRKWSNYAAVVRGVERTAEDIFENFEKGVFV